MRSSWRRHHRYGFIDMRLTRGRRHRRRMESFFLCRLVDSQFGMLYSAAGRG